MPPARGLGEWRGKANVTNRRDRTLEAMRTQALANLSADGKMRDLFQAENIASLKIQSVNKPTDYRLPTTDYRLPIYDY
ncbi:MAG: hypothetical protein ACKVZH_27005 [Blastocatellia bacterium]